MEFPSSGKNCAQSSCKQLDFLPLQCECGQVFCSEHFPSHTHNCKISKILGEDELKSIKNVFVCSQLDCKERSIVPLICEKCKKHFCIKHRHIVECEERSPEELAKELQKYTAPVVKFNEAKAVVDEKIETTLRNAKKNSKSQAMAEKVHLMKIKSKALGLKTIPTDDRVYFNVRYFDAQKVEKIMPIFVSNRWTVGRAIDAIAAEMKLTNNNNKCNEKKLRLFKMENNEIIAKNLSTILKNLLNDKVIVNGENLIIQYVEYDCIKI